MIDVVAMLQEGSAWIYGQRRASCVSVGTQSSYVWIFSAAVCAGHQPTDRSIQREDRHVLGKLSSSRMCRPFREIFITSIDSIEFHLTYFLHAAIFKAVIGFKKRKIWWFIWFCASIVFGIYWIQNKEPFWDVGTCINALRSTVHVLIE